MPEEANKIQTLEINGKEFKPVVMRIVEKDDQGRPLLLRRYFESDKIELFDDPAANEFAVVFGDTATF